MCWSLDLVDGIQHFVATEEGREFLTTELPDKARLSLSATRIWASWAYGLMPAPAVAASAVALYIQQLLFVAAHDANGVEPFFPDAELVIHALRTTGALAWLEEQEVDIPSWVGA